MKRTTLLSLLVVGISQVAMAQQPAQLVGTWNVTSTQAGDTNFDIPPKASANAYIWIVSASPNGEITVSVQGETSFPKLHGKWRPATKTLILSAQSTGLGGRTACWFKLVLDEKGNLHGVRRYLDATPAFVDFEIVAKRS
jgi:hypothetical protein